MKCRVRINCLDHGLYYLSFGTCYEGNIIMQTLCSFSIHNKEYVNITMPERFCTMYEKCKFLSMGYISALMQAE